ncbi:PaaI family thioesterase [bacterium]|nr:MAG: PaaI family thioesterase [bacterium]RKZ17546.1 MAG: PaaI family thioesterase [bacterium]
MTHHIVDLGLDPKGFEAEDYVVELDIEPRHLNIGGIVHGGVICSLLDTAMARSWLMAEGKGMLSAVTLEMKVNFLGSVKEGRLVARGRVVQRTRRTVFIEARVTDRTDRLIAAATATMMVYDEE